MSANDLEISMSILISEAKKKPTGWIGVDLDGTLAEHKPGHFDPGSIGKPIPTMVSMVKAAIKDGWEVKIFTARASDGKDTEFISDWTEEHIGTRLPVTCEKDPRCTEIWDDRAVKVKRNKGILLNTSPITGK